MDKEYIEAGYDDNIILFRWDITDICQYDCSYCYALNNQLVSSNKEKHNNIIKLVLNKIKTIKEDFEIELVGGEPTMYDKLEEVLSFLNDFEFCKKIILVSNYYKENEYFENLVKYKKLFFTFSYYLEYDNKFINKLNNIKIIEDRITITVNIHDNKKYSNKINDIINYINSTNFKFDINFLFNSYKYIVNYDENYKNEYYKNEYSYIPHKYIQNGIIENENVYYKTAFGFNYRGWTCEPLIFTIDVFGEIMNVCSKERFIKLNNLRKKMSCKYDGCNCFKKQIYKKVKNG